MTLAVPARSELRADLALLALFAAVLFCVSLGARDLWNPNEPTYGQAVAEMAASGDWALPTVGGRVFAEKSILYYWMALTAARLFGGVDELTLRLPLACSGIAGVLLVYLLVYPYVGRAVARVTALLYATTFMVWWGARSVQMDSLVTVSTLAAVLAITRVLDHGRPAWTGWTLAGLAAGLGFAAKGPVALVLPAAVLLPYLASTGRLRSLLAAPVAAGAASCLLAGAPWYLILWARGETAVLAEVLVRQNVTRYVEAWDHAAPWWYYLEYFWIDMAPWAWFVPLAVALPGRSEETRRLGRLAWSWIFGVLLFFTLSASKRSAYILPLAPAVAILAGAVAARLIGGGLPAPRRRIALGMMTAIALALAGAGWFFRGGLVERYPEAATALGAVVLLLTAGALACAAGLARPLRAAVAVPSAFFSMVLCLYLLAAVVVLPAADRYKSMRGFCNQVLSLVAPDEPLASFGFWQWRAGHRFYTGRAIPNLESEDELARYWSAERRAFLLLTERQLDRARNVIGDAAPLLERRVGGGTAYLFENRAGRPASPRTPASTKTASPRSVPSASSARGSAACDRTTNPAPTRDGTVASWAAAPARPRGSARRPPRAARAAVPARPVPYAAGSNRRTPRSPAAARPSRRGRAAASSRTGR